MNTFSNIKELITALHREQKLITEMFMTRKSLNYKYRYALEFVDYEENRLDYLIRRAVIRRNGDVLELDDQFLEFFEQILEVNDEINLSYINENIQQIKENMAYYLNEPNTSRKYAYLKQVKKTFRKIGIITLRNVVDLRRNIENTFKNEPNYKNKKAKLKNLDEKRNTIIGLIDQTLLLVNEGQPTFFTTASDEELKAILRLLEDQLSECSHNLIEIEKQIIDFLNQIKKQDNLVEKLRKLKYLRDQFRIEVDSNIRSVLGADKAVLFETKKPEPLKLSLPYLQTSEIALQLIQKVGKKYSNRQQQSRPLAENISQEFLDDSVQEAVMINLVEVRNSFLATSDNLFNFVLNYEFPKEVDFAERVTIYCQMVSQFEDEFEIRDEFGSEQGLEYALVFPL